jgi:hypothetical protein
LIPNNILERRFISVKILPITTLLAVSMSTSSSW